MRKFSVQTIHHLGRTTVAWIRGLTAFEKILLGLSSACWGLLIVISAVSLSLVFVLGKVDEYKINSKKPLEQELKAKLEVLTPQIQLSNTYYAPKEGGILKIPVLRTEKLDCNVTEKIGRNDNLGSYYYARSPETDKEKDYCQLTKQLSSLYSGSSYFNWEFPDLEWLLRLGLAFSGLFIGVEFIKYTIRAALDKK